MKLGNAEVVVKIRCLTDYHLMIALVATSRRSQESPRQKEVNREVKKKKEIL
jgi:hypothetical protein